MKFVAITKQSGYISIMTSRQFNGKSQEYLSGALTTKQQLNQRIKAAQKVIRMQVNGFTDWRVVEFASIEECKETINTINRNI